MGEVVRTRRVRVGQAEQEVSRPGVARSRRGVQRHAIGVGVGVGVGVGGAHVDAIPLPLLLELSVPLGLALAPKVYQKLPGL